MRLVNITEKKVDVDDLFFGKKTMTRGNVYLIHDVLAEMIEGKGWGETVGDGMTLPHLPREVLRPNSNPINIICLFHGGLGDAVSASILFDLLKKEYNFQIDVGCNYNTWYYVLKPMGFGGHRLDFPLEIETIDKYDYIHTDLTNFISEKTRKWDRCIVEEFAKAYEIDISRFHGNYSIPADVLDRMKIPARKNIRIGVNFESKGALRNYPAELGNQLIADMLKLGFEVYRFASKPAYKRSDFASNGYHDYSGKTNIFELAALVNQMDMVISMDSFCAHLANLFGTKTIALLSTTKPGIFQWHKNVVCMSSQIDCSPCGEVMQDCPQGFDECKAFYHESISHDRILAKIIMECKKLFTGSLLM